MIKLAINQMIHGIFDGVFTVLLGIILGLVMPKMRSNRSDGWV